MYYLYVIEPTNTITQKTMKTVLTISCLAFTLISYSQEIVQEKEQKAPLKTKTEVRGLVYASDLKLKPVSKPKGIVLEASEPKKAVLKTGNK